MTFPAIRRIGLPYLLSRRGDDAQLRRRESWILVEDASLEVEHLWAWVQAQLLDQCPAQGRGCS